MKKKIISGIIILAVASGGFFFASKKNHKPPMYKTQVVSRGDIVETVTAAGTVNPVTNISVGTQVSGTIKTIYTDFNAPVHKGQILAEIDPSLFEAKVAEASANLYSAQANLAKLKSIMANDERNYRQNLALYKQNFVAQNDVQTAESIYNADKAQIMGAQAQIMQAAASLKTSQTNLKYTKIISPVNGTVVSRNVDVGQTVAASFQTPTLFLVAQDLTKMQIDTNVAEADIGKIKEGQNVEYSLDGYPDVVFKGRVKQIRNAATTVQNVVTYDVVINVDNKDLKLKPGMTANVSIITAEKRNIVVAPNAALRFSPERGDDAPKFKTQGIWVLSGEKPERISIKTGVSDGSFTEIASVKKLEGKKVIVDVLGKKMKARNDRPPRMF